MIQTDHPIQARILDLILINKIKECETIDKFLES